MQGKRYGNTKTHMRLINVKLYKIELTEEEIKSLVWAELWEINQMKDLKLKKAKIHEKILSKIDKVYSLKKIKELEKRNSIDLAKRWRADALKDVKKYTEQIKKLKRGGNSSHN